MNWEKLATLVLLKSGHNIPPNPPSGLGLKDRYFVKISLSVDVFPKVIVSEKDPLVVKHLFLRHVGFCGVPEIVEQPGRAESLINQIEQFVQATNQEEQFIQSTNQEEQFSQSTNQVEQFAQATDQVDQFVQATNQVEQFVRQPIR